MEGLRRQRLLAVLAGGAAALLYLSASALHRRFAAPRVRRSSFESEDEQPQEKDGLQEPAQPERTATAAGVLRRARRQARKAREKRALRALVDEDLVIVVDIGASSVRCSAFAVGPAVRSHVTKTERAAARFTEAPNAAATVSRRRNFRRRAGSNAGDEDVRSEPPSADGVRMVPGSLFRVVLSSHGTAGIAASQSWGTPTTLDADGTADVAMVVRSVELAMDRCLGSLRRGLPSFRVVAVTFDSFTMNWFGVDNAGRPCTPGYTFADASPSTTAHATALRWEMKHSGGSEMLRQFHQRTGVPTPHSSYLPALLRRLSAEQADMIRRLKAGAPARTEGVVGGGIAALSCWQTLSSHIVARWAGRVHMPVSYSEASCTGMLDVEACAWDLQTIDVSCA